MSNMHSHCGCWWYRGLEGNFKYSDIFSLIAPRMLVCENGTNDPEFTVPLSDPEFDKIKPIYEVLGASNMVWHFKHSETGNDGHWFHGVRANNGDGSFAKLAQVLRP
jgi:hypothetical protein